MIEIQNLRKSYQQHVAVDGVSFQIARGETFGLLGPNGAGKTTTISMLTGALTIDSGEVRIDSHPPDSREAKRLIGVAPQTLAVYNELTADENLRFFAKLYGLSGGDLKERMEWALEFSGLADRRRDRVSTFSGGMQRRLNMACGLVHDPQMIVMDEPTVGVDPQSRNHIFECIEKLKADGRTILYTTHYMEEAQRLCDRVAIMDHGKVLDIDTVEALIAKHGETSQVRAELLGPPPDHVSLPGELDGLVLQFESDSPLEQVGQLSSAGVAFATLEVKRPNLESVFLSLTGRTLRDS